MKKYLTPEMTIEEIDFADIIVTSGGGEGGDPTGVEGQENEGEGIG